MVKVVIADDEHRICQLIINLINWDQLGMQVVGVASNGIDTLRLIEKENPDIVITDIRMPGYNGLEMIEKAKEMNDDLEFIIISGYGEFAYAQKAIEYGVKDYLLKPINRDELLKALQHAGASIENRRKNHILEHKYQAIIENDVEKVRESFLNSLILSESDGYKKYTLQEINEKYYFHFHEGVFRIVAIKVDSLRKLADNDPLDTFVRIMKEVRQAITDLTYDLEFFKVESNLYMIINYSPGEKDRIEGAFLDILQQINRKLHASGLLMTIGYGQDVTQLKDISESYETARLSIDNRIFEGIGKVIAFSGKPVTRYLMGDEYYDFTRKLIKAVELININEIKKVISSFQECILGRSITGSELKRLANEIGNIYYVTMKRNQIKIPNHFEEQKRLENTIDNCYSVNQLFQELINHIALSLSRLSDAKSKKNLSQISQAKKYIEENYMKNIALEDLGSHLGYNASYFSSIFKKETGISFIEYLSRVRIEKAKELLKEPGLRIQDICLMVGYNDVKYFTRLFYKYTGLKPNEYRKLFA